MKKSFYKILLLGGLVMMASSCINDLDQVPQDNRITIEQQFEKDAYATYLGLNAKLYAQLSLAGQGGPNGEGGAGSDIDGFDGGSSNYFRLWWSTQELPTDEAKNSWEGDAGMIELSSNNINSSNAVLKYFFYRIYVAIAKDNEFLREATEAKLNSRKLTDAQKEEIRVYRAEARFLRALHYFHAIDNFGNVPFIDESNVPGTTAPQVKTRAEIFAFIESELKDIIPTLRNSRTVYGRADKSAAYMLLAKLYLNAEVYTGAKRYADAVTYLDKLTAEGGYQLDGNYAHTFMGDNHLSSEIIFPIISDPHHSQSYGNVSYLINAAGISSQPAFYLGSAGQWGGNKTTQEFIATFETGDKRAMFDKRAELTQFITDLKVDEQGYRVTKFTNIRRDGSYIVGGNGSNFVDTDFPMFRLSDAYLMYAECALNGAGSMSKAVDYINQLRKRAGLTNINASDITADFLLKERGRELYWEGHRRQDLVRFKAFESGSYVWNWKGSMAGNALPSYMNLYPIPYEQVIMNSNLKQNPGY